MSSPEHKPAGFCPHCDYPIDAGLCPECGEFVEAANLLNSSRRLRRWVTRSLKFLIVVALFGGMGYGVYHEIQPDRWVRYVSTDYLLDLEERDAGNHVKIELDRRYVNGELTDNQIDQILRLRYSPLTTNLPTDNLILRSPWPVGVMPRIREAFRCDGNVKDIMYVNYYSNTIITSDEIWLGADQLVMEPNVFAMLDEFKTVIYMLDEGNYRFQRRQEIEYHRYPVTDIRKIGFQNILMLANTFPRSVTITSEIPLELIDKPPETLVRGRFDEERINQLLKTGILIDAELFHDGLIRGSIHDLRLAGYLHIRPVNSPNQTIEFRLPHNACHIQSSFAAYGPDMTKVNITFTPDALTAFEVGYDDYFNGIIRWKNVNLFEGFGLPDSVEPVPED